MNCSTYVFQLDSNSSSPTTFMAAWSRVTYSINTSSPVISTRSSGSPLPPAPGVPFGLRSTYEFYRLCRIELYLLSRGGRLSQVLARSRRAGAETEDTFFYIAEMCSFFSSGVITAAPATVTASSAAERTGATSSAAVVAADV